MKVILKCFILFVIVLIHTWSFKLQPNHKITEQKTLQGNKGLFLQKNENSASSDKSNNLAKTKTNVNLKVEDTTVTNVELEKIKKEEEVSFSG